MSGDVAREDVVVGTAAVVFVFAVGRCFLVVFFSTAGCRLWSPGRSRFRGGWSDMAGIASEIGVGGSSAVFPASIAGNRYDDAVLNILDINDFYQKK